MTFTIPPTLPPGGGGVNGTISALVDGVAWRASVGARAATASGLVSLTGQDTDTRVITIAVPAGVGTYSLNFGNASNALMILGGQQWSTAFPGGSGSVTVTTFTATRVAGTFTMTMQPSQTNTAPRAAQVTNGQFDLAF